MLIGALGLLQLWLDNPRGAILVVPLWLFCAAAGWICLGAARSLSLVVSTQGHDVPRLMKALGRMARAFRVEVVVMALSAFMLAALVL